MARGRIVVVPRVVAEQVREVVPQEAWEVPENGGDHGEVGCHCQHMLPESGVKVVWHHGCGKHNT